MATARRVVCSVGATFNFPDVLEGVTKSFNTESGCAQVNILLTFARIPTHAHTHTHTQAHKHTHNVSRLQM